MLSEARKYGLNLIFAHQYLEQIIQGGGDKALREAIFGNVGNIICFRLGAEDARILENEMRPTFDADDLLNLPNYNVYLKILVDGVAQPPFWAVTLPPLRYPLNPKAKAHIISNSRKRFAGQAKKHLIR